jgi:PAS domain S-box-containing protein
MKDAPNSSLSSPLVSLPLEGIISVEQLFFAVLLVVGGGVAIAIALKRVPISGQCAKVLMGWLGISLMLAGIEKADLLFGATSGRGGLGFVEYASAGFLILSLLVVLPCTILRSLAARRTIESLRGEVETTQRGAEEARAEQQVALDRYAESSIALQRTSDEAFRFEALVRSSKDAVIGLNNDGTIWHWNPAAEELCKRTAEEVLGRSLELIKVGSSSNLWKEVLRIVAFPFLKGQGEVSLLCGDGTVVPVWLSVSNLPEHSRGGAGLAIIVRNMSEKRLVEEKISASLVEKEALLKEVHHRVKNNLQLICSLLRLQAKETSEPEALKLFRKSEERIRSLALVHEKLYRSESLSTIHFDGYVTDLVAQLIRSAGPSTLPIDVEYAVEEVVLPIDAAITCGLILNELVTNSIKHGGGDGAQNKLRVTLVRSESSITIAVWDNGKAPVSPGILDQSSTLGLNLVKMLSRQLGGSVTVHQNGGVEFMVRLPLTVLKGKESVRNQAAA